MTDFDKKLYEKEIILALQNKGVTNVMSNNDVEHARILTRNLIRSATSEIVILCHRLAWQVYGCDDIADALREAYAKNPNLKCHVFIRNEVPDYTSFYAVLMAHGVRLVQGYESSLPDVLIVDRTNGREETNAEEKEGTAHFHDAAWAEDKVNKLLVA